MHENWNLKFNFVLWTKCKERHIWGSHSCGFEGYSVELIHCPEGYIVKDILKDRNGFIYSVKQSCRTENLSLNIVDVRIRHLSMSR